MARRPRGIRCRDAQARMIPRISDKMKTLLFAALLLSPLIPMTGAEAKKPASASNVTVARLDVSLPADADAAADVLWTTFANKPAEQQFSGVTVQGWRQRHGEFAEELVRRAASLKLEADALRRILDKVDQERGSLAVLPIGAYRASQGAKAVWIVVCKWEIESTGSNPNVRLGHVRMFAYDLVTLERVAFRTCG